MDFFNFYAKNIFGDVMYPYHNLIKKRIKNGELTGFEFVDNYKHIGECMLLYFSTPPFERPVRPYKYDEYAVILKEWQKKHRRTSE